MSNQVSNIILDAIDAYINPKLEHLRSSLSHVSEGTIVGNDEKEYQVEVDGYTKTAIAIGDTLYSTGDKVQVYYDEVTTAILGKVGQIIKSVEDMSQAVKLQYASNSEAIGCDTTLNQSLVQSNNSWEIELIDSLGINNANLKNVFINTDTANVPLYLWIGGIFDIDYPNDINNSPTGDFGLKVTVAFNDESTKTYTLGINDMLGNPYESFGPKEQFKIVSDIEATYFDKITSVQFFGSNVTEGAKVDLSKVTIKVVWDSGNNIKIPNIKLTYPRDTFTRLSLDRKLDIEVEEEILVKVNATYNEENITPDCYWFIEDDSVKAGGKGFNYLGGSGWRQLKTHPNEGQETEIDEYKPELSYTFKEGNVFPFDKTQFPTNTWLAERKIKCVAVWSNFRTAKIATLKCQLTPFKTLQLEAYRSITENNITLDYQLKCNAELQDQTQQNKLSYSWYVTDVIGEGDHEKEIEVSDLKGQKDFISFESTSPKRKFQCILSLGEGESALAVLSGIVNYTSPGTPEIRARYRLSKTSIAPEKPNSPNYMPDEEMDSAEYYSTNWVETIPSKYLSADYPYIFQTTLTYTIGEFAFQDIKVDTRIEYNTLNATTWSDPVLIKMYGVDDGNITNASLARWNTFNALTNNSTKQGIYYAYTENEKDDNGNSLAGQEATDADILSDKALDLFINAEAIKTGALIVGDNEKESFYADVDNPFVRIAGFTITGGDYQKNDKGEIIYDENTGRPKLNLANPAYLSYGTKGDDKSVYLGTDAISLGTNFSVDASGALKADKGTIGSWHIGEVGQRWDVDPLESAEDSYKYSGSLYTTSGIDDSPNVGDYLIFLRSPKENFGQDVFAVRKKISNTTDSTTPYAKNIFAVDGYGKMTAMSGNIAGWQFNDNSFWSKENNVWLYSDNKGASFTINEKPRSNLIFKAGSSFGVDNNGAMFAAEGDIAGWTIGSSSLVNGTLNLGGTGWQNGTGIGLYTSFPKQSVKIANQESNNWRLIVGNNFGVNRDGIMHAFGAQITGDLIASSLTLAGNLKLKPSEGATGVIEIGDNWQLDSSGLNYVAGDVDNYLLLGGIQVSDRTHTTSPRVLIKPAASSVPLWLKGNSCEMQIGRFEEGTTEKQEIKLTVKLNYTNVNLDPDQPHYTQHSLEVTVSRATNSFSPVSTMTLRYLIRDNSSANSNIITANGSLTFDLRDVYTQTLYIGWTQDQNAYYDNITLVFTPDKDYAWETDQLVIENLRGYEISEKIIIEQTVSTGNKRGIFLDSNTGFFSGTGSLGTKNYYWSDIYTTQISLYNKNSNTWVVLTAAQLQALINMMEE